jgi:hypothetical protein
MQRPRIFVSIASYRDPETPHTLRDLFAKAAHPERLVAGVLWQAVAGEDDDCVAVPAGVPAAGVRGLRVHPGQSMGVCWARHRILKELRADEEFVLQIDSHMRFVQDWDEKLLAMWAQCDSPRALLSTYPVAYTPPETLGDPAIPIMTAAKFNHRGVLMFLARSLGYDLRPEKPLPNPFVSAGFLFAPARAFDEVPYDEHLYFIGEEISLSARLWTHGWDAYTPNDLLIYHFYGRNQERPTHWADHPGWAERDARALSRVRHLLGIEASTDPQVLQDMAQFGLGQERTLAEYERYADVDLRRQMIGPAGRSGRFAPHPPPPRLALQRVFTGIFENNAWKSWETRSGSGSTWQATHALIPALGALLEALDIRVLVDAGCGDVNWMSALTPRLALYFGLDIVEHLALQNSRLLGHRAGHFFKVADITQDPLPRADAILSRNVLTHLSNAQVHAALRNFAASGARFLIASAHDGVVQNQEMQTGVWRPLDLTQAPFHLPPPLQRIEDGKGRWLAVYPLHAH